MKRAAGLLQISCVAAKWKEDLMRKLTTVLFGVLLSIGFATGASALSVDPNPLEFSGKTDGFASFSISGTTLEMTVSVTKGKLSRAEILVTDSGGSARGVDAVGKGTGPGVNIRRIRTLPDGSVTFYYKSSFFHQHIHTGQTSDPGFIVYDDLQAGDTITFTGYRHKVFGSFASVQATIVPEPSAAVLVGLGIAGLAFAGRRRA
jgi:hypothetical protein